MSKPHVLSASPSANPPEPPHHTIFFQTGGDGTGEHPKRHEIWSTRERNLLTFMGKSYLGSVDAQDYPET